MRISSSRFLNCMLLNYGRCLKGFLKWLNSESTETEQRWIPCSERLPEEYKYVLLCDRELEPDEDTGYSQMAVGWLEDGKFCCWDDRIARKEFVAWMPLPKPYKEGEQND